MHGTAKPCRMHAFLELGRPRIQECVSKSPDHAGIPDGKIKGRLTCYVTESSVLVKVKAVSI
jgi:hypothetical protein